MSTTNLRFRLNEEQLKKFNNIKETFHLKDNNSTFIFILENFSTQQETNKILQDIYNSLVGTMLSSRTAQKNSTLLLDMVNSYFLTNQKCSLALVHEKKSPILTRSEINYNNQIEKYKTNNRYKKRKMKNPI